MINPLFFTSIYYDTPSSTSSDTFDITPRDALHMARSGNLLLLDIFARRILTFYGKREDGYLKRRWTRSICEAFWESFVYLTDDEANLPSYFPKMTCKGASHGYSYQHGRLYSCIKPATKMPHDTCLVDLRMVTIDALRAYLTYNGVGDIMAFESWLTQEIIDILAVAIRRDHRHCGKSTANLVTLTLSTESEHMLNILSGISDDDLWSIIRPRKKRGGDPPGRSDHIARIVRLSPHLFSMIRSSALIDLLYMDLDADEAFFTVYESLHRGIDVYAILHRDDIEPSYHVVMAYNNLCGYFGKNDTVCMTDAMMYADVDWKVDAICHSRELIVAYADRHRLSDGDMWAINRVHEGIEMTPFVDWSTVDNDSYPLKDLIDRAMNKMIPDADIIKAIDGRYIVDVCDNFMTSEVFRWHMRSMAPMWHARIVGVVKMVKIFVDGWKTAAVGFSDIAIAIDH